MEQSAFSGSHVLEKLSEPVHYLFVDLLFPLFTGTSSVAFILTTVIFAACALFALNFYRKTWQIRSRLGAVLASLNDTIDSPDYANSELARTRFHENYKDICEKIEAVKFLKHGWSEFSETLVMPENDNNSICNTVRPHVYLNIHAADEAGKWGFKSFHSLPNLFVGVGLLCTFLGLAAALSAASGGLKGDVNQAQAALQNLMHAATFKFLTSIAGLASSIILTVLYKRRYKKIQNDFNALCHYLERGFLFISLEKLSSDQLNETRKQTIELQRFNQDTALAIGSAINNFMGSKLPEILQKTFEPMQKALENLGSGGKEAIKDIAGDDIKGVVNTINEVAGDLKTVMSSLKATSDGANTGLSASIADLAKTLQTFDQQSQNQYEAFTGIATKINEASSAVADILQKLEAAATPITNTAQQFERTALSLQTVAEAVQQSQSTITNMITSMQESNKQVSEAWQDYQARFTDIDKSLSNTFQHLVDASNNHLERFAQFKDNLDKSFDKATGSLVSAIHELSETVEDISTLKKIA